MPNPSKDKVFQTVNLAAVLVAGVLIGVITFQMIRGGGGAEKVEPAAAREAAPLFTAVQTQANPQQSPASTDPANPAAPPPVAEVQLSQRAKVLSTEFRCPCGCSMILADCTCTKTPGQRETKAYLQALVDQNKTSEEITAAMKQRFGPDVLLDGGGAAPAPAPITITPAAR